MIDNETRRKIEKHLGEECDVNEYFRECYRTEVDGESFIIIAPPKKQEGDCTVVFSEETGEFAGLERWSYARKYGEKL